MHAPGSTPADAARGAPAGGFHARWRRVIWHTLGFVLAGLIAYLIVRAYRQPDFMIDMINTMLC